MHYFFHRNFVDGERIIKQGDAADGMYFIENGSVIISVLDDSGKEVEINRITKGGYFGELALVTHRPRAASAFCDGEVKCACKYINVTCNVEGEMLFGISFNALYFLISIKVDKKAVN